MPSLNRRVIKDFEKFISYKFFKDHHKIIPLVELDEIYRHFQRIQNSNYKFKTTFAEFVDKWKNKGYKIQ